MKTAIVYDRVNKWGGAERGLLALHELFPEAPLYTSVYDPTKAPWAKVFPKVIPSFLQNIAFTHDKHELLAPLMPIAFETFDFSGYELVISVTSEAAKGIITKPPTLHVCYCLTPTRYLWSHYKEYFKGGTFKDITRPLVSYLRAWDKIAAQRPDEMIGISTAVQARIKKYYGRESELIYPPVEIKKFEEPNRKSEKKKFNYYLIVSRLVKYKKVNLVVETFNELGLPLIVVGTGSEESKLKSRSNKNITYKGLVSEEELISLYQGAKAFIFPQDEDFGITAVEAQSAGVPIIAYKSGGALDIIDDPSTSSGRFATGVFFEKQTKESLINAIQRFEKKMSFDKRDLVKNASRFSKERFKGEFLDLIKRKV